MSSSKKRTKQRHVSMSDESIGEEGGAIDLTSPEIHIEADLSQVYLHFYFPIFRPLKIDCVFCINALVQF